MIPEPEVQELCGKCIKCNLIVQPLVVIFCHNIFLLQRKVSLMKGEEYSYLKYINVLPDCQRNMYLTFQYNICMYISIYMCGCDDEIPFIILKSCIIKVKRFTYHIYF